MTADSGIKRVRVRFFETKDSARYSEVQVRAGDIKAFASGVMSQTDLLSSLEITRGTDTDMSTAGGGSSKTGGRVAETVVSGAQQEERAALLDRINTLGERGVNILGYKKQFTLLEETAKGGDKYATADALDKLTVSVKDQEKALAQKGQRTSPRVATAPAQSGQSAQPAQSAQPGESGSTGVGLPSKAVMLTVKNSKDPNYDVSKLLFGDFAPVTGPYQTERELITNAIMKKKQDGFNVRCYLQMVSDLNFYAKRKDLLTLGSQIRNAFGVLGITDDQLYKYRKLRRKIERNINAD